jgi:hypothetical protein
MGEVLTSVARDGCVEDGVVVVVDTVLSDTLPPVSAALAVPADKVTSPDESSA